MKLLKAVLCTCILILSVATTPSAHGQDACGDVLKLAGKDVSSTVRDEQKSLEIYNAVCSGSTASSNNSFHLGLDAIVEAVPVGFDLGSGSSQSRMDSFCSQFSKRKDQLTHVETFQLTAVREAIAAWTQCMVGTHQKIAIDAQLVDDQVVVGLARNTKDDASVTGVKYDASKMQCTTAGDGQTSQVATETTTHSLSPQTWSISCKRVPTTLADGTQSYPKTTLTVLTSEKNLLLPIPAEAWPASASVAELQAQIADLRARIEDIEMGTFNLQAGNDSKHPDFAVFDSGTGPRSKIFHQDFDYSFQKAPQVVLGIGGVNFDKGALRTQDPDGVIPNAHVWVTVVGTTSKGFDYEIATSSASRVFQLKLVYFAKGVR